MSCACLGHRCCSDVGISFVQSCSHVELLRRRLYERRDFRDIDTPLRAAARHLEVDGDAVQRVPDIVGQLLELGRLIAVIHRRSITQIGVVRRRLHDSKIGMWHLTVLHRRMNVLCHERPRIVDVQLLE